MVRWSSRTSSSLQRSVLTTKNTVVTLVLQKHNRVLKDNKFTKKHFDTVRVANPLAGPQGGWSGCSRTGVPVMGEDGPEGESMEGSQLLQKAESGS